MIHYQMTLQEHVAARGGYVDPSRYEGGRDHRPEMICRTGDGHARGTRDLAAVTCDRCRAALIAMKAVQVVPMFVRALGAHDVELGAAHQSGWRESDAVGCPILRGGTVLTLEITGKEGEVVRVNVTPTVVGLGSSVSLSMPFTLVDFTIT